MAAEKAASSVDQKAAPKVASMAERSAEKTGVR